MKRPISLFALLTFNACGTDDDPFATRVLAFGPFEVAPAEEVNGSCVQITLGNDDYVNINSVELTTGPGFHHSNWFFVPEHVFKGEDGTFACADRDFNEPVAAIFGGVLFAQSTQAPHEIQKFADGVVIRIPPHSKLVSQIHLLNPTEAPIVIEPTIAITPIPETAVTTTLSGVSFQNHALALPPAMESRFTVECDLAPRHQEVFGRDPDFKFYYGLAHYHELGIGMTVEGVKPDGSAQTIFTTQTKIGDALGGPIEPTFDMGIGFTRLRFSCDYYNPRSDTVRWGVGDQEMCVFLAFSDSTYNWGGGVTEIEEPMNPMQVGNAMHYTNPCVVFANDANR
jgi:hypothetical protein